MCIFTTPDGSRLYGNTGFSAHWGFTFTRVNSSLNIGATVQDGLLGFGVIRFVPGYADSSSWKGGMQIHECTFSLSALEYTGWSVTNGTISPGLVKAYPLNHTKPGPLAG